MGRGERGEGTSRIKTGTTEEGPTTYLDEGRQKGSSGVGAAEVVRGEKIEKGRG